MTATMRVSQIASGLAVALVVVVAVNGQTPVPEPTTTHPAVGSWFGKAIQICAAGTAPSACANGNPAVTLLMTPTLTGEGLFIADDSLTIGGVPFGPHTTAHGQWIATSSTEFIADYMFMLNAFPPPGGIQVAGLRARWAGQVISANTIVGWVNAYLLPPVSGAWSALLSNEFPTLPAEAAPYVTAPTTFIKDPSLCQTAGCPLVFKFTIKRVAP